MLTDLNASAPKLGESHPPLLQPVPQPWPIVKTFASPTTSSFVSQVAVGRRDQLRVFGSDWPTHDGTGVRDYIHVMDLAEGHNAALTTLLNQGPQHLTCNLGSGNGASVLDVVNAFRRQRPRHSLRAG